MWRITFQQCDKHHQTWEKKIINNNIPQFSVLLTSCLLMNWSFMRWISLGLVIVWLMGKIELCWSPILVTVIVDQG